MKKTIALLSVLMLLVFACCGAMAETPARIMALKGPTGVGLVCLMDEQYQDLWQVELAASAEEAKAAFISGNVDLVSVPTNLAAALYNKMEGQGVRLVAINTLGVLHILEKGESIQSISDLAGKTLYATGQGSTPEYVLNYILETAGLKDQVTVEYVADHDTLATMAAANEVDLVMLPEPKVTTVLMKNNEFRVALDVTALFNEAAEANQQNAVLSMGCIIARQSFLDENPDLVAKFMEAYADSIQFVNEHTEEASALVEQAGIIPKAAIAMKAIPNCHIVLISGNEMKEQIQPFFQVLFDADPKSVGGKMPGDDLYYIAQ